MIEVAFRFRRGAVAFDIAFTTPAPLVALFGESGAGKTTVLNVIAGLVRPEEGRVVVDGTVFCDTAAGVFLPPHRRRVGYVFQDARLFPHLTVRGNLAFARTFAARGVGLARQDEVVELLGLGPLMKRWPERLSGGEKQRVAIARALMANPRLLLLDEPLASIDEARRAEVFPYIERLRDEVSLPIVYVTHNASEIERLRAERIDIAAGRVVSPPDGPAAH